MSGQLLQPTGGDEVDGVGVEVGPERGGVVAQVGQEFLGEHGEIGEGFAVFQPQHLAQRGLVSGDPAPIVFVVVGGPTRPQRDGLADHL